MKDNKGFSLVEILVAIAIIGIVTAGSALSINMVSRANVDKGMQLVDSTMDKLKTECLSKAAPTYMYIYQDTTDEGDDDYFMKVSKTLHTTVSGVIGDSAEAEQIEISNVDMYYATDVTESGVTAGNHSIRGNTFVAITYNKSDSSVVCFQNGSVRLKHLIRIEADGADKKAVVTIAYETGKHSFSSTNN